MEKLIRDAIPDNAKSKGETLCTRFAQGKVKPVNKKIIGLTI